MSTLTEDPLLDDGTLNSYILDLSLWQKRLETKKKHLDKIRQNFENRKRSLFAYIEELAQHKENFEKISKDFNEKNAMKQNEIDNEIKVEELTLHKKEMQLDRIRTRSRKIKMTLAKMSKRIKEMEDEDSNLNQKQRNFIIIITRSEYLEQKKEMRARRIGQVKKSIDVLNLTIEGFENQNTQHEFRLKELKNLEKDLIDKQALIYRDDNKSDVNNNYHCLALTTSTEYEKGITEKISENIKILSTRRLNNYRLKKLKRLTNNIVQVNLQIREVKKKAKEIEEEIIEKMNDIDKIHSFAKKPKRMKKKISKYISNKENTFINRKMIQDKRSSQTNERILLLKEKMKEFKETEKRLLQECKNLIIGIEMEDRKSNEIKLNEKMLFNEKIGNENIEVYNTVDGINELDLIQRKIEFQNRIYEKLNPLPYSNINSPDLDSKTLEFNKTNTVNLFHPPPKPETTNYKNITLESINDSLMEMKQINTITNQNQKIENKLDNLQSDIRNLKQKINNKKSNVFPKIFRVTGQCNPANRDAQLETLDFLLKMINKEKEEWSKNNSKLSIKDRLTAWEDFINRL